MLRKMIFAGAALLALSACASTETQTAGAPSGRDCFRNDEVSGYSLVDNHTVRVTTGPRHNYLLTTSWNAGDLNWTEVIALRSGTGWICTGNGLGVEVYGGRPPRAYPVSAITREPEPPAPTGS